MKLKPLDPAHRCSTRMFATARRLHIASVVAQAPEFSDRVVVVADGSPEDEVLPILAVALNGARLVDVAFPMHKSLSVFSVIGDYVDRGYRRIAVMVDQEERGINEVSSDVKKRLSTQISLESFNVEEHRIYAKGSRLGKNVFVGIAINGLSDSRFSRHTVEDHLLAAAEALGLVSLEHGVLDSKEAWKSMSRSMQLKVLGELVARRELVEKAFPQQVDVLKRILGESE